MNSTLLSENNVAAPITTRAWFHVPRADGVPVQFLVQRTQRAQFVHRADRAAAGDGQADARCVGLATGLPGGVQ